MPLSTGESEEITQILIWVQSWKQCFNSPKRKYNSTCALKVLFFSLRVFLACRLDSLTYSSKRGSGGNMAESPNSKINLTATCCLPWPISLWIISAQSQIEQMSSREIWCYMSPSKLLFHKMRTLQNKQITTSTNWDARRWVLNNLTETENWFSIFFFFCNFGK